ncbi:Bdr family repetitive protein [Borrelia coriaceae]|uniref:BDR-repeat family protein n=1 Tax=Borrelia coriaceae ATCC 43381 TaxID=1408429 RepID=W5SXH0_9SPIR|nr:Bdr family repetitive protein [Borrelia coriaceae]AHH11610.1 BDR-repeat family protein [Borrelia coriaceae ATCC 43381]
MGLAQPIVTQQMVVAELTKAGIDRDIAIDLSYRYYRNELTYKDIEYLENTFNLKLEKVESNLKSDIKDLDNKIDNVEVNLKSDIKDLDNKIDSVENNLNVRIENVRNELKSDIKDLDNKIDNVRSELKSDIASVSNEISLVRKDMEINNMEIKSTLRLHNWMFGTIITISIGIFLTLMALIFK